jgi:regulator of sigma E protease
MVFSGAVTLVAFLVALGVLVVVHELGHFFVAKRIGVKVERFSVGFGPIVWRRQRGETEYALSAIPLGGYVKMLGEDEEVADDEDSTRAFGNQSLGARSAIVAAGPITNLAFAFVVYVLLGLVFGMSVPSEEAILGSIAPDTAAAAAGFEAGDRVLSVDGNPIATWEMLVKTVQGSGGRGLRFEIERGGVRREVAVTPRLEESAQGEGGAAEVYRIGARPYVAHQALGPIEAVVAGAKITTVMTGKVAMGFLSMLSGHIPLRELGGPIAIAQVAGQQARAGGEAFASMLAFLSINLGVLNLLPIPILDGGHLALFGAEAVLRRPVRRRAREMAQSLGLLVLLALMIVVFFNDVSRLIQG